MSATVGRDPEVLRIGNCSGFYGDRLSAMREMLEGGELDVLTGDWLAELTMLILLRDKIKDESTGYAKTFLRQVQDCLGLALDRGVTLVANAGGVNTPGLVAAIRQTAADQGLDVTVAHVRGDDLGPRAGELGLGTPIGAHAYLGGFGIARAVESGADVVVTGRVSDASVVLGPAIAHFGWTRDDLDALAGVTAAGHVIECGTQATGGNYPFFTEVPDLVRPGFPIAEVGRDGSTIITKHEGTAGVVNVDTVTSQLLYEIGDARYAGPDVTTRLDSLTLTQEGPDRVLISGAKGEPPPPEVKVSCTAFGGFRNEMTMVLTGLDIEAKADLFRRQFEDALTTSPAEVTWTLARTDHEDASTQQQAAALLTVVGRDADAKVVGRPFANAAVEVALGSYPGCHPTAPPTNADPYGVFVPRYVPQEAPVHEVVLDDGTVERIEAPTVTQALEPLRPEPAVDPSRTVPRTSGTTRLPLGTIAGARAGDKGGDVNVGVWVRDDAPYPWLVDLLTEATVRELLPETAELDLEITHLPNLRAVNVVIRGLLGRGVAYNARFDPQGKGVGEWLRSRHVDIPVDLLPSSSSTPEKDPA
ncbi:acyclic terpene utilization AtuA family protein [Janibacter endophyticus]|uniref:acyclic terpene utilization AtuA family protein n=1 Tax=Janibacter endophyticus TaxID=2806261 RepID=UPI0027DC0002|nr:acyclic terpene utilization AtuA family protein [Janibacter endophyticus]